MRITKIYILFLISSCILFLPACQQKDEVGILPEQVDFNFHIRPILSENCYLCHGPDISSREADLRLDLEEAAKAILDNGKRPIHAGNWSKSEISRRVLSDDPEIQMPPPEMKKQLSPREVALLEKWMNQGAEWKEYWAFIPPELPTKEAFKTLSNTSEKIDFLINKELEINDLKAAEKTEKTALIRRLSYLLTGLPPTPDAINNFLADDSPIAYEKVVDGLLDSPHFGERWARHWMDLVRYAEYKGHEFDYPVIGAWQYRDYLIRAFNADIGYDQLIQEHLAGDLLENPRINAQTGTNESIHGTQFFTFGEGKHSPVSIKQEEADYIDNMIDVTTKTFQGLTAACARCHDHKFDAIPTTDYYSLYGIFESTRFALIPSTTSITVDKQIGSIAQIERMIKRLLAKDVLAERGDVSDVLNANTQLHKHGAEPMAEKVIDNAYQKILTKSTEDTPIKVLADFRDGTLNNWTSNGLAFQNKNALGKPIFNQKRQFIKLEKAKVSSRILGTGIQGALRSPTFIIDKEKLLVRAAGEEAMIRLIVDNFQLIQNPIYGSLEKKVEDGKWKEYVLDLKMVQGEKAYIELLPAKKNSKGGKGHYYEFMPNAWLEAEYALLFDGAQPPTGPPLANQFLVKNKEAAYQNWLKGAANPKEIALLEQSLKKKNGQRQEPKIVQLLKQKEALTLSLYDSTFFQGVTEGDAQFSPVFLRGNRTTLSEEKVPHQFFDALKDSSPTFPTTGSGRKELAEAIASPTNPLTARVMVNRIWHHLFGRGIVETVDNFGLQGKPPSHPELLDYLAIQFVEEGWSIKKMIKNIVLTEAFQRSTKAANGITKKDPQNIYLSHFPIRRLEGEAIRDGILAVSGRLDPTLYGEPFEIYLTDFIKGRGRPRKSGSLDGEGRRSIYQAIRRNFLPPFMLTFDMPAPFSTFGKRNVSNVPAQSLAMMNNPLVQQQAAFWAEELLTKSASFEERIGAIYLRAFSRKPTTQEVADAQAFFKEQAVHYELTGETVWSDVRLWADYCHTIFMMKEFIFLTG